MNGVAESVNRILLWKTRILLNQSNLDKSFWAEATQTACTIKNILPNTVTNHIPFQLWYNKPPDLKLFKTFGCLVYVKNHPKKDKFKPQNTKMILLGYNNELTGYRVYDPKSDTIFIRRDCKFDENCFPKINHKNYIKMEIKYRKPTPNNDLKIIEEKLPAGELQIIHEPIDENQDSDSELLSDSEEDTASEIEQKPIKQSLHKQIKNITEGGILSEKRQRKPNKKYLQAAFTEPKSFTEAQSNIEWQKAMEEEYKALIDNNTWVLVDLPDNRKAINCKWTYKIKTTANGDIDRLKARLVAVGSSQVKGIDYTKTFAPVIRWETVRTLFTVALQFNLAIHHLDVTTAFLNGTIDAEKNIHETTKRFHSGKQSLQDDKIHLRT